MRAGCPVSSPRGVIRHIRELVGKERVPGDGLGNPLEEHTRQFSAYALSSEKVMVE